MSSRHTSAITALAFSPDGASLAALSGNSLTVWDVKEARRLG